MTESRIFTCEGIILKRKNVGEADRIITVFTKEYGKFRAIAKGIRKVSSRRAPHLEVFTRVSMVIHNGTIMERVSEVSALETFSVIRSDLKRVSLGYYYCELIDSLLPERQKHDDIYLIFGEALRALNDRNFTEIYQYSKQFTLELLWLLGFLPREKSLGGSALMDFVESITERRLKTPHFAKRLL